MGSMELRVLVVGFPVQMTVVTMVIMVTVILSTHPKVMHQILQFGQRDVARLTTELPEHKVHKVLRARQALEAGSIKDVIQQGGQDQARASGNACFLSLLQQLGNIYTGLLPGGLAGIMGLNLLQ